MGEVRRGDTQRFKGSNRGIVILAMCFETDITFVISELKAKASLREFTGVRDVPDAKEVYRLLSRFTIDQFVDMVLRIVNAVCGKRKRGKTIIIGFQG